MTKLKDSGIPWIGLIPEHWNIHYLRGISNRFSKGNGITNRATAPKLCVISNGCFESTMIYVGEIL